MLASTIQFSKYGQENQPTFTTYQSEHPTQGNNTPGPEHPHQRFGESRPQPPDTHRSAKIHASVTQKKKPQTPKKNSSRWPEPDSSGPNSAPRPPTRSHSTFHASPSEERSTVLASCNQDPGLMVNVPHSEAPSPWNERPRNDE
jgi:hypothetical protein